MKNNKNKIIVLSILLICVAVGAFFLFRKPKEQPNPNYMKPKDLIVGFINYDNSDSNKQLQDTLKKQCDEKNYEFLSFNSDKSASTAYSNIKSLIQYKANYIIVNYPDKNVCDNLIKLNKDSNIPIVFMNEKIENNAFFGFDNEKTIKEISDKTMSKVKSAFKQSDFLVVIDSFDSSSSQKSNLNAIKRNLSEKIGVEKDYITQISLPDEPNSVKDNVLEILSNSHDRQKITFICHTNKQAKGIYEALKEKNMTDKAIISSMNISNQPNEFDKDSNILSFSFDSSEYSKLINDIKSIKQNYNKHINFKFE